MDKADFKRLFIAESLNGLLETRSLDRVSVVELCERAGISRSTFYTYFDDIYCVGEWLWDYKNFAVFDGLGRDYGYYECYVRLFTRLRDTHARFGRIQLARATRDNISYARRRTTEVLTSCLERSLGRCLTPDERMQLNYVSAAEEAMTLKWFADGMDISPERLARYVADAAPQFMKDALGE